MSGRIFINYRRADSRWFSMGINDRLRAHFGRDATFMDVSDMRAGVDFVEALQEAVRACDVLIAVIGPRWLEIKDEHGNRRLENPEDYVRVELAEALERGIRVIPLLVDETSMPRRADLPENLKPLSRRHFVRVNSETYTSDTQHLIDQIEDALAEAEQKKVERQQQLAEEQAQAELQRQIDDLLAQAEIAMEAEEWSLAEEALVEVLALDAGNRDARARLEIVRRKINAQEKAEKKKQAEEQARLERQRDEEEKAANERSTPEEGPDEEGALAQSGIANPAQEEKKIRNIVPYLIWGIVGIVVTTGIILGIVFEMSSGKTPKFTEAAVFTTTPTVTISSTPTSTSTPAPALGVGSSYVNPVDGATAMYIPAGSFLMGSEDGDADEGPVHEVYLDAFWMYQTEVTITQFADFLNQNGNQVEGGMPWLDAGYGIERIHQSGDEWLANSGYEDHPVDEVSWYGAAAYCEWAGGRLPTEAEWEKAARGGLEEKTYPWGDRNPTCSEGVDNGAQFRECNGQDIPVASFGANGYGLHDVAGNVWEWVADWYEYSFYVSSPSENPQGPSSGGFRVVRGGGWVNSDNRLRVALRYSGKPGEASYSIGFRCALPVNGE